MPEDASGRSREMIDRGRTGAKRPGSDLSAAPLGTDAEASGAATVDALTARETAARHEQARIRSLPGAVPHANSGLRQPASTMPWLLVWAMIILGAIAIVVAALET
jgi:hypothetical protein